MKIITKKMITPIQFTPHKNKIHATIYNTKHQFKTLQEIAIQLFTYKNDHYPLLGNITPDYTIEHGTGKTHRSIIRWDINYPPTNKVFYQYKMLTLDQDHNFHQDRLLLGSKVVPHKLPTKALKPVYEIFWKGEYGKKELYEGIYPQYNMAITFEGMINELYQLKPEYQETLPRTLEGRKNMYWQPGQKLK